MPEWMKVVVGLTILVIMASLSMSLFVAICALAKAIWRAIRRKKRREFTSDELLVISLALDAFLEQKFSADREEMINKVIEAIDEEYWEKRQEEEEKHERLLDS